MADLNDRFVVLEEMDGIRKRSRENRLEPKVRHVATSEPQNLGRYANAAHDVDKILVLCEHDNPRLASTIKDLWILGVTQAQIPNVDDVDAELSGEPRAEPWRNLSIHPQNHAAITG